MKTFLVMLLLSVSLFAVDTKPTSKTPEVAPTKTEEKLPEVSKDVADALKNLVIEGQAIQIQLNDIEKSYRQVADQSNANIQSRQGLIVEAVKKAGLDPEKYSIVLTVKGVVTFVKK